MGGRLHYPPKARGGQLRFQALGRLRQAPCSTDTRNPIVFFKFLFHNHESWALTPLPLPDKAPGVTTGLQDRAALVPGRLCLFLSPVREVDSVG